MTNIFDWETSINFKPRLRTDGGTSLNVEKDPGRKMLKFGTKRREKIKCVSTLKIRLVPDLSGNHSTPITTNLGVPRTFDPNLHNVNAIIYRYIHKI